MFDPKAARERCDAATPEPWTVYVSQGGSEEGDLEQEHWLEANTVSKWPFCILPHRPDIPGPETQAPRDAEFIAHARSDLPAALEAMEEAQGKLELVSRAVHGNRHAVPCEVLDRILSKEKE